MGCRKLINLPDEFPESESIYEKKYAAIDLETTGLSFRSDRVVEIGIVVWQKGKKTREFATLINPERPISKNSYRIHGINNRMVADSPTFREIADEVSEILRDTIILGYNIFAADLSFLNKELREAGRRPIFNPIIDTYLVSRKCFPSLKSRSLRSVAENIGIKVGATHRALEDARLTMKIWLKMLEKFRAQGIETFRELKELGYLNGKIKHKAREILELARETGFVKIVYQSPYSGRTERVIEPISIRGSKIDAYCHLREDFRTFELSRIVEIKGVG